MLGATLALTAAGALACLVMAVPQDRETEAGPAAVTPAASIREKAPAPAETGTPTPTTTPPTASGSPTPSPATTTTAAMVSPADTPQPQGTSLTASAAGRIRPGTTYQGVATAYKAGTGDGACLFGPSPDLMIAAMNTTDYETSRACGAYVLVRAANGNSVTVRITNECPLPCAPGQLDLSEVAFAKLADPELGRIPITWSLLSPSTPDAMSIRYKTGSSSSWCGIQAIDHRNPVARLEVRAAGEWRQLPRTAYNYFISTDGSGCGGAIRITDIYGERLTVSAIALRPDTVQRTQVQFARH